MKSQKEEFDIEEKVHKEAKVNLDVCLEMAEKAHHKASEKWKQIGMQVGIDIHETVTSFCQSKVKVDFLQSTKVLFVWSTKIGPFKSESVQNEEFPV